MRLSEIFQQCCAAPYRRVENGADYALRREGNTLYLFFQPSIGLEDWKNNLDFPAKPYRRMDETVWHAHRGFLRVWKSVEGYLQPAIAERSVKKILVAGYSHGAALAVFCHEYIWFHRPDLRPTLQSYGFGCPRVVWGVLPPQVRARWEGFMVIRNRNDSVTHLPPAFLGYRHVGRLLEVGQKGKYKNLEAHKQKNILAELKIYEERGL